MKARAQKETSAEQEPKWEIRTQELMAVVRKFGRWPVRKRGAQNAEERGLAKRVHNASMLGKLDPSDDTEIAELRWIHQRELGGLMR